MRPRGLDWAGLLALATPFALTLLALVASTRTEARIRTYDRSAPRPSFTLSPPEGTAPLRVRLDGTGSRDDVGITEFAWFFGDGSRGEGPIADHVFASAGTYRIRLKVFDAAGHSRVEEASIEVQAPVVDHAPPRAQFVASSLTGPAPLTVALDASWSQDDHSVTRHQWTFGDGTTAEGIRVSHTFTRPGSHRVELTVSDAVGRQARATQLISVVPGPASMPPNAAFTLSREATNAPALIAFDASESYDDRGIVSYQWDFGDDSTGEGAVAHHRYSHAGTYLVKLTVADDRGQTDHAWKRIELGEHPVVGRRALFDDAFATDVHNSSWAITAVQTEVVHSGKRAIAVVPGKDGAFRLTFPTTRLDAYNRLEFWINGRDLDRVSVRAMLEQDGHETLGTPVSVRGFVAGAAGGALDSAWRRGAIPLTVLNPEDQNLVGFAWQAPSDDRPAPFHLDDISLLPSDVDLPVLSDCSAPPPIRDFVGREDGHLVSGGVPFRAVGANLYYLQQHLSRHLQSGDLAELQSVRQALDAAACAGVTVIRTMGFNDSPPEYGDVSVIQPSPGVYREEGLRGLDLALAEARAHHLRVILTLTNNWTAFGGLPRYAEWADVPPDSAVTTPEIREQIADYSRMLARRVNTMTGIRYRDDPTILAVELVNELRCRDCQSNNDATTFQLQLAHDVARAWPLHLIADGGEGFDDDASLYPGLEKTHPVAGHDGTSFSRLAASPDIDLLSYHLYPDDWHLDLAQADAYIDAHQAIARRFGKVAYLGEFGEQTLDGDRSATYDRWLDRVFVKNAGSLAIVWQLTYPGRLDNDGFALVPGDSAVTIATIARRAHSLNASGLDGVSLAYAASPETSAPSSPPAPASPASAARSPQSSPPP